MGYSKDVFRGVSWIWSFRILTRIFSIFKTLIIARILSPSDLGIFGVAALTLTLVEIATETGVNVILVQLKSRIEEYVDSAWVVSIGRGVIISIFLVLMSPIIANFFKITPSIEVLYLVSIVPLIRGFINPSMARLQKELRFNYEFLLKGSVFIFDSIISIMLVIITQSVYGLIFGLIAGVALELLLSFLFLKPIPRFRLKKLYVKEILSKGKWVTAYGILNYGGEQGDNIAVGRLLGASSLGIYQMAYKISYLPISEISDVINRVVFPIYSKIESDRKRLIRAYKKTTIIVLFMVVPAGLIFYMFPSQIVNILLGKKWEDATPIIRILSFYGVARAIYGPSTALFLALGKQRYIAIMTFVRLVGLGVTVVPLVIYFGMIGAAYSAFISVVLELPFVLYFVIKILKDKK